MLKTSRKELLPFEAGEEPDDCLSKQAVSETCMRLRSRSVEDHTVVGNADASLLS